MTRNGGQLPRQGDTLRPTEKIDFRQPSSPAPPLSGNERQRIEREIRHAQATAWPEGDSWIRGYAEDCEKLLAEIDRLKHARRAV